MDGGEDGGGDKERAEEAEEEGEESESGVIKRVGGTTGMSGDGIERMLLNAEMALWQMHVMQRLRLYRSL